MQSMRRKKYAFLGMTSRSYVILQKGSSIGQVVYLQGASEWACHKDMASTWQWDRSTSKFQKLQRLFFFQLPGILQLQLALYGCLLWNSRFIAWFQCMESQSSSCSSRWVWIALWLLDSWGWSLCWYWSLANTIWKKNWENQRIPSTTSKVTAGYTLKGHLAFLCGSGVSCGISLSSTTSTGPL